MNLTGHHAIITGGSRGLGKAIATEFLRQGASILVCARDAAALEKTRTELEGFGRILTQVCDVSDETSVAALTTTAFREFGTIDSIVCNAGVLGPLGSTENVNLKEWFRTVEINLLGTLLLSRALIPHFKQSGKGKIIAISGGGATSPLPNISAYAASKAALVRLIETLAEELRNDFIDVNAVAPGAMHTRMLSEVLSAGPEAVGESYYAKNKKWAEEGATPPELGAALCAYLASSDADGITGKLISAQWDAWKELHQHKAALEKSDIYCLRRIIPQDRGLSFEP